MLERIEAQGGAIECGNQENLFLLYGVSSVERSIARSIEYLQCPLFGIDGCKTDYWHLNNIRGVPVYTMIFEHFVKEHYKVRKNPSGRINTIYSILQELVVWEANNRSGKGKASPEKMRKRQLVVHNLMKHCGLPLRNVCWLLGLPESKVCDMAYGGYKTCRYIECRKGTTSPHKRMKEDASGVR